MASSISTSFKVLKCININKCKPTVFSLLFLHYEWHHITLGCWVMIREQWCWFDELCMKGLLSTLPSFSLGKARLLKAILMCAFVKPLCGPFWLSKLQIRKFRVYLHRASFCLCQVTCAWGCHSVVSAHSVVYSFVWLILVVCLVFLCRNLNWHLPSQYLTWQIYS